MIPPSLLALLPFLRGTEVARGWPIESPTARNILTRPPRARRDAPFTQASTALLNGPSKLA
jgi:hypothetical protein